MLPKSIMVELEYIRLNEEVYINHCVVRVELVFFVSFVVDNLQTSVCIIFSYQ